MARRNTLFSELTRETIEILQGVMDRCNPFARQFFSAYERYRDHPFGTLQVVISQAAELGRRYDAQSYPEVAAMVVENSVDGTIEPFNIVINDRTEGTQLVSSLHASYMPLHYVLMFPFGEHGWHPAMRCERADGIDTTNVTLREFCAYMLMIREGDRQMYHHHFGRLFQQYIVDNYVRIESARLNYIATNQSNIRAELYGGIGDGADPRQIGRSIVLPSSFTGGPRYMKQMLQDGLAIVRQRGNPTLFVTFTCNPQWPEILAELLPGQKAYDRPDICSRVFQLKVKDLLSSIKDSHCFGRINGYIATVEFQKRGLPHLHLLVILDEEDRPRSPTDFDRFVSAELPNPVTHAQLYKTVTTCMIHGPCRPNLCMQTGRCKSGYPKPFNTETRVNRDGYPLYKRPNNQRQHLVEHNNFLVDNRYVVPYNPYLCHKYDAHINVEICTSARAIKYLCKYITKGSDHAQIQTQNAAATDEEDNEVFQYQNARYIGPCEAVWRTFEFRVHMHNPTVSRLDLHLPDEQIVRFRADMTPEELQAARDAAASGTKLLAFFSLCSHNASARQYLYTEILCHYTWNTRDRQWEPRTNPPVQNVVTRIYAAALSNMPLYCLRLLLLHVRGPTSFQQLRTYENTIYDTFQEAAVARGLLESDEEWDRCLAEACQTVPAPAAIRALFAYILINCSPAEPLTLWMNHRERMTDDYFYALRRTLPNDGELTPNQVDQMYRRTLGDIESRLQATGHHLSEFPSLPQDFVTELDLLPPLEALEIVERQEYFADEQRLLYEALIETLNARQHQAFDMITNAIDESTATAMPHFFL